METTNQEVAVKEESQVAVTQGNSVEDALLQAGMSSKDLLVPKLLLMQSTSDAVQNNLAKVGELRNSQNDEIVASYETTTELFPISMMKTWRVMDMTQTPAGYIREEPCNAANESRSWEGIEHIDGKDIPARYDMCYTIMGLLKSEIDNDEAWPVSIKFKRTSAYVGKVFASHMFKRLTLGKTFYSQSVGLSIIREKNDNGQTYAVYKAVKGTNADEKALAAGQQWADRMKTMNVKIDDREEADVSSGPAAAPTVVGAAGAPSDAF